MRRAIDSLAYIAFSGGSVGNTATVIQREDGVVEATIEGDMMTVTVTFQLNEDGHAPPTH